MVTTELHRKKKEQNDILHVNNFTDNVMYRTILNIQIIFNNKAKEHPLVYIHIHMYICIYNINPIAVLLVLKY